MITDEDIDDIISVLRRMKAGIEVINEITGTSDKLNVSQLILENQSTIMGALTILLMRGVKNEQDS